jgi:phosphate-selective porin OprO and OprP
MNSTHARHLVLLGVFAALNALVLPSAPARADETEADPGAVKASWKDGIRLETADKKNQLHVGGRIHYDWAFFQEDDDLQDAIGAVEDGVELRRARLIAEGLVNGNVEFKNEFDFGGGRVQIRDVYVGLRKLPAVGTLRIGHFKEPLSLEEITSSVHITFIERSLANNLVPSRNPGVMLTNTFAEERVTASAGFFRDSDASGNRVGDGEYNGTGRVTWLPVWKEDGGTLVHLGAAASIRNPNDEAVRLRARPEANLAPFLVDTDSLGVEAQTLFGGEAAVGLGPFAVQGEYVATSISSIAGPDPSFGSYYVQGSWFLTGEHQNYRHALGAFGDVIPGEPTETDGGVGAWQLAARYSHIGLNDDAIVRGGELTDVTFGLNWYPNTITRFMANVVLADAEDLGHMTSIVTRVQVVF